ncbi:integral membrane protein [Moelleriella libera RCEF 2490]|uniref:Integral membrane protein n=1 Tax=Moelleriella libera RCEF 2490 TaxID=1081109 RepID=A0A166VDY0_9HYPO|nr:integral membrane protein [Moelleriella libera RCEF 2490]
MAIDRIVSLVLRSAELVFAAIVAGVTGDYLHKSQGTAWDHARFIYTISVAGLSILLGLIWLFPFSSTFTHWPVDVFMSLLWWAAFGLLANLLGSSCGAIFNWDNISPRGDQCGRFKAVLAFSFLSAILWLASALIGLLWVRKHERRVVADGQPRRRWFRRARV